LLISASCSSSNPKVCELYRAQNLAHLVVPVNSHFVTDVKLQRNTLLLIFNISFDSSLGKGQIVRSKGVEAVIDAVTRNIDNEPDGTVVVVHGMGCLFDILRTPPMPFQPKDAGTCLEIGAIRKVRDMAMARGIKGMLERIKGKEWKVKGVELQGMAEVMMTGMD